jgi:phosphoglycerol geranylgeranyltransferase
MDPTIQKKFQSENKQFAVLIDPDKYTLKEIQQLVHLAKKNAVDYFFFGGSLLTRDQQDQFIKEIKATCDIPLILFPGNHFQINPHADGILFLSLISGRNPELLIGKHVVAAPYLKASNLEIIPTGYILVDGGNRTTVAYMSNTSPIPADKNEITVCTALAGELLGMQVIYLDAGSGAQKPVPASMITQVKKHISVPLVVGGGICTPEQAQTACRAGADIIVTGNAIEKDKSLIAELSRVIHQDYS